MHSNVEVVFASGATNATLRKLNLFWRITWFHQRHPCADGGKASAVDSSGTSPEHDAGGYELSQIATRSPGFIRVPSGKARLADHRSSPPVAYRSRRSTAQALRTVLEVVNRTCHASSVKGDPAGDPVGIRRKRCAQVLEGETVGAPQHSVGTDLLKGWS